MFELMGYQRDNTGTLVLEGPIDPLKVASVSRDAIVAFVECKVRNTKIDNMSLDRFIRLLITM